MSTTTDTTPGAEWVPPASENQDFFSFLNEKVRFFRCIAQDFRMFFANILGEFRWERAELGAICRSSWQVPGEKMVILIRPFIPPAIWGVGSNPGRALLLCQQAGEW